MNSKNVLYITYDGLTDPLGQSQIIPYLEGLTKAGYKITIISCEKKEKQHLKEAIKQQLESQSIRWVPLNYTKKPPILSTVYDIRKIMHTARNEYKRNSYSLVHCRSYISAFAGLKLKKELGVKFIFDMRGFWADERVEGNIWKLSNPVFRLVYNYFKKKEKQYLINADYIISLTENAMNEIHSWKQLPNQPLPIQVIPCCADMQMFDRTAVEQNQLAALKQKLSINNSDFVLSYIGSLGSWYLLDEMLRFFKQLLASKPNAKFLFITNDPSENILGKAASLNIPKEKIRIYTAQRKEMPLYILCGQLSIFFIKPSFSKKASSPVKQGEVMSMGIPIICNAGIGDTDMIIESAGAGIAIKDFSEKEFATAINKIDELLKIPPEKIREGGAKFYSLQNGIQHYLNVYNSLITK